MPKMTRPSPALVVASLALFVAGGGGAWAANTGHLAVNGTSTKTSASKRGPRGPRGFQGLRGPQGIRGIQGATGAQGTAGAQGPAGQAGASDGFVTRAVAAIALPAGVDTTLAQLNLPANGAYVVTVTTELGNSSGIAGFVDCTLFAGATSIAAGSADLPAANVFADTLTLTGAATAGGLVRLSCVPDNSAQGRNNSMTAVQVAVLHTQ
jgi:hypothetical protein